MAFGASIQSITTVEGRMYRRSHLVGRMADGGGLAVWGLRDAHRRRPARARPAGGGASIPYPLAAAVSGHATGPVEVDVDIDRALNRLAEAHDRAQSEVTLPTPRTRARPYTLVGPLASGGSWPSWLAVGMVRDSGACRNRWLRSGSPPVAPERGVGGIPGGGHDEAGVIVAGPSTDYSDRSSNRDQ